MESATPSGERAIKGEVEFRLLYESREDWQDPPLLGGPVRISVSPYGKFITVERTDGDYVVEGGSERYGVNWHEFDNLIGRLLTLVDASFADVVQREAFKDMVRHQIKEWVTDVIDAAAHDARLDMKVSAPFVGGISAQMDDKIRDANP